MTRPYLPAILAILAGLSLAACEQAAEGPAEKAGKQIDEAVENTRDAVEDSIDKAGDKIEQAGDAIEEKTDN